MQLCTYTLVCSCIRMQQYSAVESLVLLIQIICIFQPTSRITNLQHHLLLEIALMYFCISSKCNSVFVKHGNTREVLHLTKHKMTLHMRILPFTIVNSQENTFTELFSFVCNYKAIYPLLRRIREKILILYLGKHSVCGLYKVFPIHL